MVQMSVLIIRIMFVDDITDKTVSPRGLYTKATRIFQAAKPNTSTSYTIKHLPYYGFLGEKYFPNAKINIFIEKKDKKEK